MPRFAKSKQQKVQKYVRTYSSEFTATPNGDLYCKCCSAIVQCEKQYTVDKHRATSKHLRKSEESTASVQQFINVESKWDFARDVSKSFLSADIPLWKLRNPELRRLFARMGHPLPSEETCRSRINLLYDEEIGKLRDFVKEKPIFFVVDEADVSGSKYVCVLVGILDEPTRTYMCDCVPLQKSPNAATVIHILNDVIPLLGCDRENVSLLLTDAASYMMSAVKTLRVLYPTMFHVTCGAHLLHNCAMRVRAHFDDVDCLIARIKALCLKNKQRANLFIEIGSPPTPIVTRWASWIKAATYYADKLPQVRAIVDEISSDGLIPRRAKEILRKESLPSSLLTIRNCYSQLATAVERLENSSYTISEAFAFLQAMDFGVDPCDIGKYITKRLQSNDMSVIVNMGRTDISPTMYGLLQKCQPSSTSVERSFSMLSKLLAKDRNFKPENVKKHLMVHYNCVSRSSS